MTSAPRDTATTGSPASIMPPDPAPAIGTGVASMIVIGWSVPAARLACK